MIDAKTMQLDEIVRETAVWIAKMAQNQATVDHARYRLRELIKDESGVFKNLAELVKKELENGNN